MDLLIKGKVALVGASGNGLGLATACRLAMEGCADSKKKGRRNREPFDDYLVELRGIEPLAS